MDASAIVDIGTQTLQVTLLVALPLLGVSLVVGLLVSLFQVATSLQDMTLTFVPKIVAVFVTLIVTAHWILSHLLSFTRAMLTEFHRVIG